MDLPNRMVTVDSREIQLTPTEYDLLRALVMQAGKVLTNRQLLRQVWGEGYDDLHILRVNIYNLRHKIEPDPSRPTYIHTESGVGYRLKL
jgi:two-component system KDP operon response regulator KdpE